LRARRDAVHARIGELDGQARATAGMIDSAEAALAQAQHARLALQALIERLQLARSTEVAAMRAQLVDGSACPVCGSAEHPYAHAHAVRALFEQADDAELVRAQTIEADAREHWQRLQQQRADVAARRAESAVTLDSYDADLAQRLNALADGARVVEIAEQGADGVLVRLQQEQLTSEQALAATRIERASLVERQRVRERLSERRDAALARRDEAGERRQRALTECDGAGLALATLATRQQQLREQLDARRAALEPLLPPADRERLVPAPAAALRAIETRVVRMEMLLHEQQALLQTQSERAQARELTQHDHAAAQALLAGAAAALAEQVAHLQQRRETLRERLGLHTDTASWSLQQTQARERADAAAAAAAVALQRASQHCAALVDRDAARALEAAAHRSALVSPDEQIQAFLARTPAVDPALLDRLCAEAPEAVARLRSRIEAADTQLFAARLRVSERSETLDVHAHGRELLWQRFHGTLNAPPALSEIERPLWAGLVPRRELSPDERVEIESAHAMSRRHCEQAGAELDELRLRQREDEGRRLARARVQRELALALGEQQRWGQISELIGSADGSAFRAIAQAYNLELLLAHANEHLIELAPRYRLKRSGSDLGLLVDDRDMGDSVRSVHSLSGGESFLTSLALALGLAAMSSRRLRIESLFIDEGFGVLDPQALDLALNALDGLQSLGRKVGVISHVAEMLERIPVQIRVQRMGQGTSAVDVVDTGRSA
jgi:exonuclease SbcC